MTKMPSLLLDEIMRDALDGSIPVSAALRNLVALGTEVGW
jgi:hypothetical protein